SWVHTDYIGKPLAVTNTPASGTARLLWTATYTPLGLATPNTNPSGLGAFTLDFRFPGQIYDAESGLHYNNHRTYDPRTGRYLHPDRIGLASGGYSSYAYARNLPLRFVDTAGLCVEDLCIGETIALAALAESATDAAVFVGTAVGAALGI